MATTTVTETTVPVVTAAPIPKLSTRHNDEHGPGSSSNNINQPKQQHFKTSLRYIYHLHLLRRDFQIRILFGKSSNCWNCIKSYNIKPLEVLKLQCSCDGINNAATSSWYSKVNEDCED